MFSWDNDCIILLEICKIYCRFKLNEPVILSLKTTYMNPFSDEVEQIFLSKLFNRCYIIYIYIYIYYITGVSNYLPPLKPAL